MRRSHLAGFLVVWLVVACGTQPTPTTRPIAPSTPTTSPTPRSTAIATVAPRAREPIIEVVLQGRTRDAARNLVMRLNPGEWCVLESHVETLPDPFDVEAWAAGLDAPEGLVADGAGFIGESDPRSPALVGGRRSPARQGERSG
jgi:hypothetical protein